jgi:hypothetical protein
MHKNISSTFLGLCACLVGAAALPADAQTEVKERPPMYTYEALWSIPRARWGDMEKSNATDEKPIEKALTAGTLVGYGSDTTLVHTDGGNTHDSWFSAMSMAGVLNALDDVYKAGGAGSAVLSSATQHEDVLLVSRFYNWRSGSWKGAYTHDAKYVLKEDAADDAVATMSKAFIVPLMEKLLADGTIVEYEVDEEAIHTESPGTFWVSYLTPTAEGLDKASAALAEAFQKSPLLGAGLSSLVEDKPHRDALLRSSATYK